MKKAVANFFIKNKRFFKAEYLIPVIFELILTLSMKFLEGVSIFAKNIVHNESIVVVSIIIFLLICIAISLYYFHTAEVNSNKKNNLRILLSFFIGMLLVLITVFIYFKYEKNEINSNKEKKYNKEIREEEIIRTIRFQQKEIKRIKELISIETGSYIVSVNDSLNLISSSKIFKMYVEQIIELNTSYNEKNISKNDYINLMKFNIKKRDSVYKVINNIIQKYE